MSTHPSFNLNILPPLVVDLTSTPPSPSVIDLTQEDSIEWTVEWQLTASVHSLYSNSVAETYEAKWIRRKSRPSPPENPDDDMPLLEYDSWYIETPSYLLPKNK